MPVIILSLVGGLALLSIGAEFLVRSSARLAIRFGVSSLVVGLTVVAFGTSAPELVVSITSGLKGLGDVAIGNVVGSNIFNVAVILGLSALISPLKVNVQVLRIDTPIMVGVSMLFLVMLFDSSISRVEGLILLCGIIIYTSLTIYFARKSVIAPVIPGVPAQLKGSLLLDLVTIIASLGALVLGSRFFVNGAVAIAKLLSVSEAVIGLTIVAAGTSLPELATSIAAAIKKEEDIAIGNIVGSNIFNILSIAGITGTITPLWAKGISFVDLSVMVTTSLLLLPLMRSGFKLDRVEGGVFLMVYGGYLFYIWPK